MSNTALTCEETPLAWPKSAELRDLNVCSTCGVRVHAPYAGSLQVSTRRPTGDGVNIDESNHLGIDYRGQRYSYDGAIFHTPGLHIFPGQNDVYPAEYHIHMKTLTAPYRTVTLIIPVSHLFAGPGESYFAAVSATPDPSAVRPTLNSIIVPGAPILQYVGPSLRGRTRDNNACMTNSDHHNLLIMRVAHIRATDLERIPREGSASTDPRDLPAPGIRQQKTVPRDRLVATAVYASPGILGDGSVKTVIAADVSGMEVECAPVQVVDGRDVIEKDGKWVDIRQLLGLTPQPSGVAESSAEVNVGKGVLVFLFTLFGLFAADWVIGHLWTWIFAEGSPRLSHWEKGKIWFFLLYAIVMGTQHNAVIQWFS